MPAYARPGVYVNESPLKAVVTNRSGRTTASFVGQSTRGPVGKPVLVTSWNSFVSIFGDINSSYELGYSVYQYFSNGGVECYVVRTITASTAANTDSSLALTHGSNSLFTATSKLAGADGDNVSVHCTKNSNNPDSSTNGGSGLLDVVVFQHRQVDDRDPVGVAGGQVQAISRRVHERAVEAEGSELGLDPDQALEIPVVEVVEDPCGVVAHVDHIDEGRELGGDVEESAILVEHHVRHADSQGDEGLDFLGELDHRVSDPSLAGREGEAVLGRTEALGGVEDPVAIADGPPETLDELVETAKALTNWSVTQDALELVVHVVRNDKPFTEIQTAAYMMVNPYSAIVFSANDVFFNNPLDHNEFRPAQVPLGGIGSDVAYPHAGVLTSPAWLNRFPTTATNVNRHRSRMVYDFFLATDVLKLAERSLDQSQITAHNPTMNESACSVCHTMIDPIAGAFQNWDNKGRYRPPVEGWHQDMRPPGFGAEVIPSTQAPESLRWLGNRLVADRRFVTAVVQTLFSGIMGHPTLRPPSDPQNPKYSALLSTYLQQDEYLKTIENVFMEDNYNLKTAIKALIMSPYFRAENYTAVQPHGGGAVDQTAAMVALNQVGTGRLLTPERLNRRIENVTGYAWLDPDTQKSALLTTYRIFYGGIDFKKDMNRVESMSGMMANVAQRMANEVACQAVAYDFTLPAESRTLFPYVEWDYAPTEKHGFEVPEMIDHIKNNILYLHSRLLGETLTTDSPEFTRTYDLFMNIMEKGQQLMENELATGQLPAACHATMDLETGDALPDDIQMVNDPEYTIRAWMAVTAYLLSDYRFLFE